MAVLRHHATGRRVSLGVRCLVGRAQIAHLEIPDSTISAEHATIYFDGSKWKLRDLASRNGTFVDEQPVHALRSTVLEAGALLRFGPSSSNTWLLECGAPPGPSALSGSGDRVLGEGDVLWLPDARQPEACVSHHGNAWRVDTEMGSRLVTDGDVIQVDPQRFTLELPPGRQVDALRQIGSTVDGGVADPLRLTFVVSRDEEHVSFKACLGSRTIDLGARTHNYTLLVLAQRRREDELRGVAASEAGWVYSRDLFDMLRANREAVNLLLWRATQSFKKAGLPGEQLIERRLDSGQIRLGIEEFTIVRS